MHDTGDFKKGIRIGGAATAVLLAFLYTVAAPTTYYRARIPFLLASGGVGPFLFAFGIFMSSALIGLVIAGARSRQTLWGTGLVAIVCALAVSSGAAADILPQFPESNSRWAIFALLAALAFSLLVRERVVARKARIQADRMA